VRVSRIVVFMGVTGAGKTTIGRLVAEQIGVPFLDADDFHDAESVALMRSGHPLDTAHRKPWLDRVNAALRAERGGAVLACSALTGEYRTRLTRRLDDVTFVVLTGDADLIGARLAARRGHFARADLLPSQLATLKPPPDAIVEDVRDPPEVVASRVVDALER
jgi:gluconokinase